MVSSKAARWQAVSGKLQASSSRHQLVSSKRQNGKLQAASNIATSDKAASGKAARAACVAGSKLHDGKRQTKSTKAVCDKATSAEREPSSGVSRGISLNKQYYCESLSLDFKMAMLLV